jgi:site-specific recombinase XerC
VPTPAELATLRNCPDTALRWVILAASEAGLRSGAAYACTIRDCAEGRIAALTKNSRRTNVPTSPRLAALLATIPTDKPPDTPVTAALDGAPVTKQALQRRWWRWKKQCGIRKELRLHDLRRGLARAVYNTTGDLRQVQGLLTHSSLTSTLWYLDAGEPTLDRYAITAALALQDSTDEPAE